MVNFLQDTGFFTTFGRKGRPTSIVNCVRERVLTCPLVVRMVHGRLCFLVVHLSRIRQLLSLRRAYRATLRVPMFVWHFTQNGRVELNFGDDGRRRGVFFVTRHHVGAGVLRRPIHRWFTPE